jgi:hypothetical protein
MIRRQSDSSLAGRVLSPAKNRLAIDFKFIRHILERFITQ